VACLLLPLAPLGAQDPPKIPAGFTTELKLAIDPKAPRAKKLSSSEATELQAVLKGRLPILSPDKGTVEYHAPDDIRVRVKADAVTDTQLKLYRKPGIFELRHLEDVQTGVNPGGRFTLDLLNINGKVSMRFRERPEGRVVPIEKVLDASPLIVGNREVVPGSCKVVTGTTSMAVRVRFTEAGAKKLDRFAGEAGRLLAVVVDNEIVAINAVPQRPKSKKKDKAEREAELEAFSQVDVSGGFTSELEANALAVILNAGPLNYPLNVVSTKLIAGRDASRPVAAAAARTSPPAARAHTSRPPFG
jgi:preprotein translocase subunit SecD